MDLMISTDNLRRLLDQEPDVRLKLFAKASEKIAEEIHRKAIKSISDQAIDEMVKRVIKTAEQSLRVSWGFPAEAKKAVEQIASEKLDQEKERLLREVNSRIEAALKSFSERLDMRFEKKQVEFAAWAEREVRALARDEFVKTLNKVRDDVTRAEVQAYGRAHE